VLAEQYVRGVVRKYSHGEDVRVKVLTAVKGIYPYIRFWGDKILKREVEKSNVISGTNVLSIIPTGSFVKGTNIRGATDIDLLISLSRKTGGNLREIYKSLSLFMKTCGFPVREQNVSIRIQWNGLSVDLVPAKKQIGAINDHSIYVRKADSWTKTNVHKHVRYVTESKRRFEIRAAKIWRELHGIKFPSFYLEMSVIQALNKCRVGQVAANFLRVLEYLSSEFESAQILDPANSNNFVSDELTSEDKKTVVATAQETLMKSSWGEIIW
jgi:hypothetical protein